MFWRLKESTESKAVEIYDLEFGEVTAVDKETWKRVEVIEHQAFAKGDVQITINNRGGITLIAPVEVCDDYFERCDMMMNYVFAYTLYEIIAGGNGGRGHIHESVNKHEAIWFLGILGLTMDDRYKIYKMRDGGDSSG